MLSSTLIAKFQAHYYEVFGTQISEATAEVELSQLTDIFRIIARRHYEATDE